MDAEFLEWFRDATETMWRAHVPRDFQAARVGGLDWTTGTKWRGGLTAAEVQAAEQRYGLRFPPDYRLFLATLHTPDPPQVGAFFKGSELVPATGRAFPDWTGDAKPIETALEWPLEGLLWSIEQDTSWHHAWGPRPRTKVERERVVRQLAAAGPQLIPVYGHRYLAASSDTIGNPVLSIYGSDVIVYGENLRVYLLAEFGLVAPPHLATEPAEPFAVPFWDDVIEGFGGPPGGGVG